MRMEWSLLLSLHVAVEQLLRELASRRSGWRSLLLALFSELLLPLVVELGVVMFLPKQLFERPLPECCSKKQQT